MRLWICLICGIGAPAMAEDRAIFLGTWGTPEQCAQKPIIEGGTKLAAPFEITRHWLRNADTWCALRWFPIQRGQYVSTRAQCGEDSQIAYRLDMLLQDDTLTLFWNEALANGPLRRCPTS